MAVKLPTADNFNRSGLAGGRGVVSTDATIVERAQGNAIGIREQASQNLDRAQSTDGLTRQAFQFAAEEKAKMDDTRVQEAINKLRASEADMAYGKDGYLGVKGGNLVNRETPILKDYTERYQKTVSDIGTGLTPSQRSIFDRQAKAAGVSFQTGLMRHTMQEHDTYEKQTFVSTNELEVELAATNWRDMDAVAASRGRITANFANAYQKGMLTADQVQIDGKQALSAMHAGIIGAMTDANEVGGAKAYMEKFGNEITEGTRQKLDKIIEVGDFETRTQGFADTLIAKHGDDVAGAIAEARKTLSGKEEDAAIQRIKVIDSERVQLRERAQADAADSAWKIYSKTNSLSQIPPSTIAAMDGRALESLRKTAKADQDARINRVEVKTDPNIYYGLSAMAGQDPEAFKGQDLRGYFDKLSPSDRKHFIDLQQKAASPEKTAQVVSVEAQKSAMVKALNLQKQDAGAFYQVADKELFAAQQENGGKPLNQEQRQKVLDKLVIEGNTPGRFFGSSNTRLFKTINDGTQDKFKPTFSDADRNKATAALQRRGIKSPTPDQINATIKAAYGLQ